MSELGLLTFPGVIAAALSYVGARLALERRAKPPAIVSGDITFLSEVLKEADDNYPHRVVLEVHRAGREAFAIANYPIDVAGTIEDAEGADRTGKCCGHTRLAHGAAHFGEVKYCIECAGVEGCSTAVHDFVPVITEEEVDVERALLESRLSREVLTFASTFLGVRRGAVTLVERRITGVPRLARFGVLGDVKVRELEDEIDVDAVFARFVERRGRRRGISP